MLLRGLLQPRVELGLRPRPVPLKATVHTQSFGLIKGLFQFMHDELLVLGVEVHPNALSNHERRRDPKVVGTRVGGKYNRARGGEDKEEAVEFLGESFEALGRGREVGDDRGDVARLVGLEEVPYFGDQGMGQRVQRERQGQGLVSRSLFDGVVFFLEGL